MLVYVIRNTVNAKVYIGLTCGTLANRWRVHVKDAQRGSNQLIHKAIRRYGADKFVIEELSKAESREELDRLERFYIQEFKSYPPSRNIGYNMTEGGEGYRASYPARKVRRGYKLTPEARRNISLGHMGNKNRLGTTQSEETRKKIGASSKGRKDSEQTTQRRSAARKGKPRPELQGRKQSPEDREKKRQAALRRWAKVPQEERREHMAAAHAAKDDGWRDKLSAAQKKLWEDPEYRARTVKAYRKGWKKKKASAE